MPNDQYKYENYIKSIKCSMKKVEVIYLWIEMLFIDMIEWYTLRWFRRVTHWVKAVCPIGFQWFGFIYSCQSMVRRTKWLTLKILVCESKTLNPTILKCVVTSPVPSCGKILRKCDTSINTRIVFVNQKKVYLTKASAFNEFLFNYWHTDAWFTVEHFRW